MTGILFLTVCILIALSFATGKLFSFLRPVQLQTIQVLIKLLKKVDLVSVEEGRNFSDSPSLRNQGPYVSSGV